MSGEEREITVSYYAALREQRVLREETLRTQARDAGALYDELRAAHGFSLPASEIKVAVNDAFVSWSQPLAPGDHVVFLPPVSGG